MHVRVETPPDTRGAPSRGAGAEPYRAPRAGRVGGEERRRAPLRRCGSRRGGSCTRPTASAGCRAPERVRVGRTAFPARGRWARGG
jgi:hypothetical protein